MQSECDCDVEALLDLKGENCKHGLPPLQAYLNYLGRHFKGYEKQPMTIEETELRRQTLKRQAAEKQGK